MNHAEALYQKNKKLYKNQRRTPEENNFYQRNQLGQWPGLLQYTYKG